MSPSFAPRSWVLPGALRQSRVPYWRLTSASSVECTSLSEPATRESRYSLSAWPRTSRVRNVAPVEERRARPYKRLADCADHRIGPSPDENALAPRLDVLSTGCENAPIRRLFLVRLRLQWLVARTQRLHRSNRRHSQHRGRGPHSV
jgi:hypothetical protein